MAFLVDLTGEYDYKPTWTPPKPVPPTQNYSLSGPQFADYNISMDPNAYPDGLGHYTIDGGKTWLNSDGSPYVEAPMLDPNKWAGTDPVGDDVVDIRTPNSPFDYEDWGSDFAVAGSNGGGASYLSGAQQPDPFANFDANDPYNSGVGGGAAEQVNATYQQGNQYLGDAGGSGTYQQDSSGNVWNNGLWYSPDFQYVHDGNQWLTLDEFNKSQQMASSFYNTGAKAYGEASAPETPTSIQKLSNADWTNFDAAMDRPSSVTPSAGFYNVDAALDPYRGKVPGDYSGVSTPLDPRGPQNQPTQWVNPNEPNPSGLSRILGGAQKFLNAGAETGRDLFEGGLQSTPITAFPLAAYDIARGRNPLEEAKNRLAGGGTFNNLAKPQDFIAQQNADLSNRGTVDELVTSTVFDPSNLIGAGFATKALKGAEGASALSKILRGAGAANEAIDVGTAKAFGAGAKYLGREALGAGVGVGANALAGGGDNTGLDWWQAGLIGALGGSATRKVGSGGISDLLAKAQGRTGLSPALGGQIDDVTDPAVRELLGLDRATTASDPLLRAGPTQQEAAAQVVASQKMRDLSALSDEELRKAYGDLDRRLVNAENRVERMVANFGFDDPEVLDANRGLAELEGEWQRMEDELRRRSSSGEIGSVSANLAFRGGLTAAAAGAGYATAGEDASQKDRLIRAALFGGAMAAGPEVIGKASDLGAKAYGGVISKIPITPDEAVNQQRWLQSAEDADAIKNSGLRPDIAFKQNLDQTLPWRSRLANEFWKTLVKVDSNRFGAFVMSPEVKRIAQMHHFNEQQIDAVAQRWVDAHLNEFALFDADPHGAILIDGSPIPVLSKEGLPSVKGSLIEQKAGFADLMENKEWYLENNYIDQARYDALNTIQRDIQQYPNLEKAFGIAPDPLGIDPANGAYFTHGKPTFQGAETTPLIGPDGRRIKTETTADHTRRFATQGEGINQGYMYPPPAQAAKEYISDLLKKVNAVNTENNLMTLGFTAELRDGTKQYVNLKDFFVDPAKKTELAEQIKANRELRKDRVDLQRRQKVADRDARFASRWVDSKRAQVEKLNNALANKAIAQDARANAARLILDTTDVAISDSEFAAREYLKRTEKLAVGESEARTLLKQRLSESARVRKGLAELNTKLAENDIDALLEQGPSFLDGWNYADTLRAIVAEDAARLESQLAKKAVGTAEAAAAHQTAQEALREVQRAFPGELQHTRQLQRVARAEQAKNAVAAERVRVALSGRETRLIDQAITQRAQAFKVATAKSAELQTQIDQLSQMIAPVSAHTKQLQADIAATRRLGNDVGLKTKGRIGNLTTGLQGWDSIPLPGEWANTFHRTVKDLAAGDSPAWKVVDFLNNTMRLLGATLDVSRFGSVGALGFWDNPGTSGKGFVAGAKEAGRSFKNATAAAGKTIENINGLEAMAKADGIDVPLTRAVGTGRLSLTGAEQFHPGYADAGTLADKFTKLPLIRQADIMYSSPANIERVTRFYDSLRVLKATGKDYTSDLAIARAANSANLITGRASSGLGAFVIGEKAASRAFFASHFVQSQIETVMNAILVGGVEGTEARRALLRLALGGAAVSVGINALNGNATDWHPFNGDYVNSNLGRIRVLDQDISVFGPWDSLVKGALATYKQDPLTYWRGKLGPIASMGTDWAAGEDAIGQDVDRTFSSKKAIWDNVPLPFAAKGILETAAKTDYTSPESLLNLAASAATNIAGVKASPLTEREKFQEVLGDHYPDWVPPSSNPDKPLVYPKPKNPLDDPLYVAVYGSEHPGDVPTPSSDSAKEYANTKNKYAEPMKANTDMFIAGTKTLGDWREDRKLLKAEQKAALDVIRKDWNGQDPPKDSPAYWLNEYYKAWELPNAMGKDGKPDYDVIDAAQAEMLARAPSWVADYIDEYFLAKADSEPERQYREALNKLSKDGYFSGEANSMKKYQGMASGSTDEEIDFLNDIMDDWGARPKYDYLNGKPRTAQAVIILGDYWKENNLPYDSLIAMDVGNSSKPDYMTTEMKLYKLNNKGTLAWLNPKLSYSTIQSLNGK